MGDRSWIQRGAAYGGDLQKEHGETSVIPKDGLRARFHVVRAEQRLHVLLQRDGFAKDKPIRFDDSLKRVEFTVENRAGLKHDTSFQVSGIAGRKVSSDRERETGAGVHSKSQRGDQRSRFDLRERGRSFD